MQTSTQTGAATETQLQQTIAELRAELENLMTQRFQISSQIAAIQPANPEIEAVLAKQIAMIDEQLRFTDYKLQQRQIELAQTTEAQSAPLPDFLLPRIPDEYVFLSTLFLVVTVLPVSLAFARRIWKRTAPAAAVTNDFAARFEKLQTAVDATAIEVERIGEGQRFVNALVNEQMMRVSAPASTPVPDITRDSARHITPH